MHIDLKIDIYVPYCLDTCNKYLRARVSRISGTRVQYLNGEYRRYSTGHGNGMVC